MCNGRVDHVGGVPLSIVLLVSLIVSSDTLQASRCCLACAVVFKTMMSTPGLPDGLLTLTNAMIRTVC